MEEEMEEGKKEQRQEGKEGEREGARGMEVERLTHLYTSH